MTPGLRKHLGEKMRQARSWAHFTQEQVAEQLNVSVDMIWRWEDGRAAPMLDRLVELTRLYEVSADWLLGLATELSDDETLVLSAYRTVAEDQRALARKIMEDVAGYHVGRVRED